MQLLPRQDRARQVPGGGTLGSCSVLGGGQGDGDPQDPSAWNTLEPVASTAWCMLGAQGSRLCEPCRSAPAGQVQPQAALPHPWVLGSQSCVALEQLVGAAVSLVLSRWGGGHELAGLGAQPEWGAAPRPCSRAAGCLASLSPNVPSLCRAAAHHAGLMVEERRQAGHTSRAADRGGGQPGLPRGTAWDMGGPTRAGQWRTAVGVGASHTTPLHTTGQASTQLICVQQQERASAGLSVVPWAGPAGWPGRRPWLAFPGTCCSLMPSQGFATVGKWLGSPRWLGGKVQQQVATSGAP